MRIIYSNFSSGITGFLIIAAIFLLPVSLIFGFAYVIKWAQPLFYVLISSSILLFIFYVLPLSISRKNRNKMSVYSLSLANVCAGCAWFLSFMFILLYLKWWAFLVIWIFNISVPLAVVVLLYYQRLAEAGFLAIAFLAAFVMRRYAFWLKTPDNRQQPKPGFPSGRTEVIDAEIVE